MMNCFGPDGPNGLKTMTVFLPRSSHSNITTSLILKPDPEDNHFQICSLHGLFLQGILDVLAVEVLLGLNVFSQ
jgi:hypothetical protein